MITRLKKMTFERLNKKGTLKLLIAMQNQAKRDIRLYGHQKAKCGSDFVSRRCYISALNYMDVELPAIREALGECFKD